MGFNCSYVLKVAILRTAEIAGQENPSSLIRRVMEDHCRRVMGEGLWHELSVAESSEKRRIRLTQYLRNRQTCRLRDALKRGGKNEEILLAELSLYARELEQARDDKQADLILRVALHEAVDVLLKIGALLKKSDSAKRSVGLLELTRQLAEPLRDDVDAAVRVLIEWKEKPKRNA